MKILLVADKELKELWDYWDVSGHKRTEGVDLILSAGDLDQNYLEFLVTMLNVPCLYVRGNHDGTYDDRPPEGCINIDGKVCEISVPADCDGPEGGTGMRTVRIAGLGGSMRYRTGTDMYTEEEMQKRVRKLLLSMRRGRVMHTDERKAFSRELIYRYKALRRYALTSGGTAAAEASSQPEGAVDILLTHAPCFGHGDMGDLAHRGFECFNELLSDIRPAYHCYGHVNPEYESLMQRITNHPSGTQLINVCGMHILEL